MSGPPWPSGAPPGPQQHAAAAGPPADAPEDLLLPGYADLSPAEKEFLRAVDRTAKIRFLTMLPRPLRPRVLSRGPLNLPTVTNPSALLESRMVTANGAALVPSVDSFVLENMLQISDEQILRCQPPDVQRHVLKFGNIRDCASPGAALQYRIDRARSELQAQQDACLAGVASARQDIASFAGNPPPAAQQQQQQQPNRAPNAPRHTAAPPQRSSAFPTSEKPLYAPIPAAEQLAGLGTAGIDAGAHQQQQPQPLRGLGLPPPPPAAQAAAPTVAPVAPALRHHQGPSLPGEAAPALEVRLGPLLVGPPATATAATDAAPQEAGRKRKRAPPVAPPAPAPPGPRTAAAPAAATPPHTSPGGALRKRVKFAAPAAPAAPSLPAAGGAPPAALPPPPPPADMMEFDDDIVNESPCAADLLSLQHAVAPPRLQQGTKAEEDAATTTPKAELPQDDTPAPAAVRLHHQGGSDAWPRLGMPQVKPEGIASGAADSASDEASAESEDLLGGGGSGGGGGAGPTPPSSSSPSSSATVIHIQGRGGAATPGRGGAAEEASQQVQLHQPALPGGSLSSGGSVQSSLASSESTQRERERDHLSPAGLRRRAAVAKRGGGGVPAVPHAQAAQAAPVVGCGGVRESPPSLPPPQPRVRASHPPKTTRRIAAYSAGRLEREGAGVRGDGEVRGSPDIRSVIRRVLDTQTVKIPAAGAAGRRRRSGGVRGAGGGGGGGGGQASGLEDADAENPPLFR